MAGSLARLLLRLGGGGFLLPHGLGKLLGWFGGPGLGGFVEELRHFGLPASMGLAVALALVQTLAGLLVALGLRTREAGVVGAAFLAVTVLLALPNGWFWMARGVEYPLLWTITLVAVVLLGPGEYSIDGRRDRRRAGTRHP